jgi:hypothetical protein
MQGGRTDPSIMTSVSKPLRKQAGRVLEASINIDNLSFHSR